MSYSNKNEENRDKEKSFDSSMLLGVDDNECIFAEIGGSNKY